MPIPALAFAIPGAIKTGLGIYQAIKGSRMNPKRPNYEIPEAAQEELGMSRMEAAGRMPGIGYAENRLQQGKASGLYALRRGATNSSQLLSGLSGIQMQANIAERGLLESEANDQYRRLSNLRRSLQTMGQYQDKQFQLNKMEPYQDEARTKAALVQSGLVNTFSGIGEGISGMMDAGRYNAEMDYMKSLSGGEPGGEIGELVPNPSGMGTPPIKTGSSLVDKILYRNWMRRSRKDFRQAPGLMSSSYNRDING